MDLNRCFVHVDDDVTTDVYTVLKIDRFSNKLVTTVRIDFSHILGKGSISTVTYFRSGRKDSCS